MKAFVYIVILLAGVIAGWLIFGSHGTHEHLATENAAKEHSTEGQVEQEWTCSMHPQIRQKEPGKCPLCGMDLVPVAVSAGGAGAGDVAENSFVMSAAAVALSNVETINAKKSNPQKVLRLYGSIFPNERLVHSQTAHIGGRIEKLSVNSVGESVKVGQVIASVYSPELLTAQTEFLEAIKQKQPVITEAAREKLRLLKITEKQIAELEKTGKVNANINIIADAGGIVTAKKVERGSYIEVGMPLFDIANLNSVWAEFNAYESDLPYLKVGDLIGYTVSAVPNEVWTGRIEFISPIVDEMSRTAKVRMESQNKNSKLKPGMIANALIHNAKISGEMIILPKSSLLWTGERSVVYIARRLENSSLSFSLREVELGPSLGDSVSVLNGIEEGELVVASGVFALDASVQLAGKTSMMNRTSAAEFDFSAERAGDEKGGGKGEFQTQCPPASPEGENGGGSLNNAGDCIIQKGEFQTQGDSMNKAAILAVATCIAAGSAGCEEHKGHTQGAVQAVQTQTAAVQTTAANAPAAVAEQPKIQQATLQVSGNCEMCKMRIESAAKSVAGVKSAVWNVNSKILTVSFDESTNLEQISKAIAAAGHDTKSDKASDAAYNALPGCCKYRGN